MFGYDHMAYGGLWMIIFWVLVVIGIVFLIKFTVDRTSSRSQEPSAMEVLKRRYASGEISKEEYDEKKKDLIS
ncbi:MAG TPA: SHOCT domain-containing protein [candidate division Zixibacteria bacterium]|nr:SHOCT domain-containing protein [candidate division Zixibacteria bacterium]